MLKTVLENSKYLVIIAVVFALIASLAAFLWGAVKTVTVIIHLVGTYGGAPSGAVDLIRIMDTFLIATALLIFSVGMYELFIEDVPMPAWLIIHNLHDLKAKLGSVIVLVLAVTFLEHLVEWKDPSGTLYFGIAITLVSVSLIAFSYFGEKD
jgi:uncharacterized membrane protein YqhA